MITKRRAPAMLNRLGTPNRPKTPTRRPLPHDAPTTTVQTVQKLVDTDLPILILFYSTGCGHCTELRNTKWNPLCERFGQDLAFTLNAAIPAVQELYQKLFMEPIGPVPQIARIMKGHVYASTIGNKPLQELIDELSEAYNNHEAGIFDNRYAGNYGGYYGSYYAGNYKSCSC